MPGDQTVRRIGFGRAGVSEAMPFLPSPPGGGRVGDGGAGARFAIQGQNSATIIESRDAVLPHPVVPAMPKISFRIPKETGYNHRMQPVIEKQHIETTPGVCGGKPRIAGHRIRVEDIVLWTEQGQSVDEIVSSFPQLSLADVHAALAYYFDHQPEIDSDIRRDDEFIAQLKERVGSGPIQETE